MHYSESAVEVCPIITIIRTDKTVFLAELFSAFSWTGIIKKYELEIWQCFKANKEIRILKLIWLRES